MAYAKESTWLRGRADVRDRFIKEHGFTGPDPYLKLGSSGLYHDYMARWRQETDWERLKRALVVLLRRYKKPSEAYNIVRLKGEE